MKLKETKLETRKLVVTAYCLLMNEMAGSSSSQSQAPKILLAKPPGLVTSGPAVSAAAAKFGREDETAPHHHHRSRLPSITSLNLLSDSWDFHIDRFLPVCNKYHYSNSIIISSVS